jgi:RNA polymerase subunit RPABC4/transcription elongation factor Spt4
MSPELINTIGTIAGVIVAALGAFLFAFWIAMGIWAFHDIRQRTRDWLVIILAVALVLIFPLIGLILYMMIRPKATLAEVYDRALEEEALLRELEQTAACHNCGVPVKEAWVYCPNCHNQLQHSCPTCGNLVRNEWEICVYCGSAQQRTAPQLTAAGAVVAGQATLQSTSKGQLSSTNMPTQTMPAQAISAQTMADPSGQVPPATTGRSYRSPFRRDAVAPPPPPASLPTTSTATSTPAVTPPPSDVDDAPFRPARMPE